MIEAFAPLHFDVSRAGPFEHLVTQPYDKITPAMKVAYAARSPYSTVHLIRGETSAADFEWYGAAAHRIAEWKRTGALLQSTRPAYFVYRQAFTDAAGRARVRTGVTGAFDLEFKDCVLHHERTHAGPRRDRRMLLDATGVHFGHVFLLRFDGPPLRPPDGEPWGEAADEDGVRHTVSVVRDAASIHSLRDVLASSRYVIADGHHRFTVACEYAGQPGFAGARRVMVTAVDVDDPGLVVLPTHRVLAGLPAERTRGLAPLIQRLGGRAVPHTGSLGGLAGHAAAAGPGTAGVALPGAAFLLDLKALAAAGPAESEGEALDVARLQRLLIDPLLSGLPVEEHVRYRRHVVEVEDDLKAGANVGFIVNAVAAQDVVRIARAGGVMPQKSTDFYPKMLSGFMFCDVHAAAQAAPS